MMEDRFFDEIASVETTYRESTGREIKRTYKSVRKRLQTLEIAEKPFVPKTKTAHRRMVRYAFYALLALCLGISAYSLSDTTEKEGKKRAAVDESETVFPLEENFVVKVYAATSPSQQLCAVYEDKNVTEVKKGEAVVLGKYSPLDSSVPGYPLLVSGKSEESGTGKSRIRVETERGEILSWDKQTGEVVGHGKAGYFTEEENLYWSPLSEDAICSETKITMSAEGNEKEKIGRAHV